MSIFKNKIFFFYFTLILSSCLLTSSCRFNKEIAKAENKPGKEKPVASKKIEKKYAELLNVPESDISNARLYSFIDDWYGVPYKYGGKNKNGIDCSNFTSTLYKDIYNKTLTGSSSSIFNQCKIVSRKELREGDLVFFKIEKDEVSHIGVYLQNNKFVHATTKKGVMIDDLDEAYYKKYYYKAGRLAN
ncbi:MAG: glycoside hydrolase [Bacteroidetes bacterium]|nr:glycoside hydrolase [Bacteroidota bacterium]